MVHRYTDQPSPHLYSGTWWLFSGNELGTILGTFLHEHWLAKVALADDGIDRTAVMVTTNVSSHMLSHYASMQPSAKPPLDVHVCGTGFKNVGHVALTQVISTNPSVSKEILLGYEEAIGYMVHDIVPDKDGVSALLVAALIARTLAETKRQAYQTHCDTKEQDTHYLYPLIHGVTDLTAPTTLLGVLHRFFVVYGYFVNWNSYFKAPQQSSIQNSMKALIKWCQEV